MMDSDGFTTLETCNEAAEEITTFEIDGGLIGTGATSDFTCFAGFDLADIDADTLTDIIEQSEVADGTEYLTVEIYAWDGYTPSISLSNLEGDVEEYDLDGELLGLPINPLQKSERDEAVAALVAESGINAVVDVCVDPTIDAVTIGGESPEDKGKVTVWQYVNYPLKWDIRPMIGTHTFDPLTVDLEGPLDRIVDIEALYADEKELSIQVVCVTTEYDDHQVVVAYYLADDQLTASTIRYALTDLAGTVIEKN